MNGSHDNGTGHIANVVRGLTGRMVRSGAIVLGAAFGLLYGGYALAETYPTKPITLIVPYNPGGGVDTLARSLAEGLRKSLGQPVLVENRPGGSEMIGLRQLSASNPDGYTLGLSSTSFAINPFFRTDVGYDPVTSYTPVGRLATMENVLAVNPRVPVNNLKEFIDLARSEPDRLSCAHGGLMTSGHLLLEMILIKTGITCNLVPYSGGAATSNAILAGEVDAAVSIVLLPLVKDGRIRGIATGGPEQSVNLPDVAPVNAAVPDLSVSDWMVLLAPAGVPEDIVAKLYDAVSEVAKEPGIQQTMQALSYQLSLLPPAATQEFLAGELDKFESLSQQIELPAN